MIKSCGDSVYKPVEIIFTSCLNHGMFPAECKNANVVPMYKKRDDQYVTISICINMFNVKLQTGLSSSSV